LIGTLRVLERQVRGLAFLVVGHREADIGQAVEAQHAIGLGIVDRLEVLRLARGLGIRFAVAHRAERVPAGEAAHPHVDAAQDDTAQSPYFDQSGLTLRTGLRSFAIGPPLWM
jgi:hypothetical protein